MTKRELGERIRMIREMAGWTQADLGQRMQKKRSHAAVSDIERGKTGLDIEDITDVAVVLDVPISALILPFPPLSEAV